MARNDSPTDADAPTDNQPAATFDPDTLIGKRVFNPDKGMGKDVIVDRKTVRNGRGDERDVFVCDKGVDATDHPEVSRRFVNRDVDKVVAAVEKYGYEAYEVGEEPWGADPSDYALEEGDD